MAYHGSSAALAVTAAVVGYKWVKHYIGIRTERLVTTLIAEHQLKAATTDTEVSVDDSTIGDNRKVVKKRGLFRNYLVQEGKAKFGCPKRTEANRLVIRKYLYDRCVDHGVLPRHIAMNLDFAVETVFVPTDDDIVARAVPHTYVAKRKTALRDYFGDPTPTA
jgi:hypothetical protein